MFQGLSYIQDTYCRPKLYQQDTYVKVFNFLKLLYNFGIQVTFFEIYNKGLYGRMDAKSRPFLWIIQTLYFFMCPIFLIILIVSLMSCCSSESARIRPAGSPATPKDYKAMKPSIAYLYLLNLSVFAMILIVLHTVDLESASLPLFDVSMAGFVMTVVFGILLVAAVFMRNILK